MYAANSSYADVLWRAVIIRTCVDSVAFQYCSYMI
jgi:hypothetical protein